jgi:hypothetical protein
MTKSILLIPQIIEENKHQTNELKFRDKKI